MGRELKREEDRSDAAAPPAPRADAVRAVTLPELRIAPRPAAPARWFDALDPEAAPRPPRRARLLATPLFVVALLCVAVVRSVILRVLLPIALAVAAVFVLVRGRRPRPVAASPVQRRGLGLDGDRLRLHVRGPVGPHTLLALGEPFGVTLLATPRRDRVVAMLSSSAGAFYVGTRLDAAARRAHAALLERASTVGGDEGALEALGPDGEPILLAPDVFAALLDELLQRAPGCLDRFLLTDARGAALRLDGRALYAGDHIFDLSAPLEWRAFVFQEALGQAVALYQGTWVRQTTNEIVLVCLLPVMSAAPEGEGVPLSSLDRGVLRDLRLMQGAPENPPPSEQRVAVDRLMMVPIRSALDRAPRPAAQPTRARA